MASSYYDSDGKTVYDGDVAYASDLNTINTAVDTGFQLVETAISGVVSDQVYYTDLAQKWAEYPEDVEVEPGGYSALHWAIKAGAGGSSTLDLTGYFERGLARPSIKGYVTAAERYLLVVPQYIVNLGGDTSKTILLTAEINLGSAASWDEATYATAANRAGKDFYIYGLRDESFILSANSTVPVGESANDVRKIGGFHCLCLSVGTISGHTLTGFVTGDIIPNSIWDMKFRPVSDPEGMAYVEPINKWVDIYRSTSTPSSVFGGSAATGNQWSLATDYLLLGKKQHPSSVEFIALADGSNEGTNVAGSSATATTGGWTDTAGRRMVSNYGIEDCCGVSSQWLRDPSYQNASTYSGTFAWSAKQYGQGSVAGTMQTAGGDWNDGANCGQDCRKYSHKWGDATTFSCSMRGVSDAIIL